MQMIDCLHKVYIHSFDIPFKIKSRHHDDEDGECDKQIDVAVSTEY